MRHALVLVLAVACLAVLAQGVAAFDMTQVGGHAAINWGVPSGTPPEPTDHKYTSTYNPPAGPPYETITFSVIICCTCAFCVPNNGCCPEWADLVWRVNDANGNIGPGPGQSPLSEGGGNGCSPCDDCITFQVSRGVGPKFNNNSDGWPAGWKYPSSGLTFEVKAVRCKCCGGTTTSTAADTGALTATPLAP